MSGARASEQPPSKATARRCPDNERFPGDIVGCGSGNVTEPDHEGLCDCLNCGMFFRSNEGQEVRISEHPVNQG